MKRNILGLGVLALALGLAAPAASAQQFLMETFDDNSNGWTLGTDWVIGAATAGTSGSSGCNPDPDTDAAGVLGGGVAGTNPGGSFPSSVAVGGLFFIVSPVIDTSAAAGLSLEFQRWLNADYLPFMDNRVEVFDGSCWVRVATYGESASTQAEDAAWQTIRINVSDYANANFQVRFGTEILSSGAFTSCNGWNIDNVRVQGTGAFYERFDNNSAGWTTDGAWEINPALAGDPTLFFGDADPGVDGNQNFAGGIAGVVIGLPTDDSALVPFEYLTSPVIDTTDLTNPTLSFDRFLGSDYLPYMQSTIEVFDGAVWQEIFEHGSAVSSGLYDTDWSNQVIDLTPFSNANLQVRWGWTIGNLSVFNVASWNVDNVCIFDGNGAPLGQASGPQQALDINGSAVSRFGNPVASGDAGPYNVCVSVDGPLAVSVQGVANQPWVLLFGQVNTGANPIAPFGQIDLGTPGLNGLQVAGSGLDAGFNNSFFVTGNSGQGGISYFVPVSLAGAQFGFQAIMVDPAVQIRPTNAVDLTIVN
jgi:hypothetical protein